MRSLLIRIFVSFWLIIMITIVAAAGIGYTYAERARSAVQNFEISEAMLAASTALHEQGHEGLTEWLDSLPGVTAAQHLQVAVAGPHGCDCALRSRFAFHPPPVVP